MPRFRASNLLLPLALLGAAAVGADDAKPDDKAAIPMAGQVTQGVVNDDHFYAVADGALVDVDLQKRTRTILSECYANYPKLKPFVDVADGKACVASDGRLHVINLKGGMIEHSAEYKGEVHGLGFASENRVFVLGRLDVVVVDVAGGETVQTIPILHDEPNQPTRAAALSSYQKVGKLLYVADSSRVDLRLKAIDLEAGKVVGEMGNGFEWLTGLRVVGDRVFVRSINLGYGVYNPLFGYYDLKTKKRVELKPPVEGKGLDHVEEAAWDRMTLVAGPGAGVCLAWKGKVYQYDGEGRPVGATPLAADDDSRLLAVWNGVALTAGKDCLRLTPLAKAATAKSE